MNHSKTAFALLGATALGLAVAAPAMSQTSEANACDVLTQMIDKAGDNVSPDFADAAEVAQTSDGNACLLYVDRVEQAGGITAIAPTDGGAITTTTAGQGQQTGQTEVQSNVRVITPDEQTGQQDTAQQSTAGQPGTGQQTQTGQAPAQPGTAEQATTEQPAAGRAMTGEAASEGTAAESTTTEEATNQAATDEAAQEDNAAAETDIGTEVVVSDITGRDVVTSDGEEVGEIDRIIVINDEPYVVFKRGGFFGLGSDDVAVPAAQMQMQGEELVLTGIGTDEFEAMPEFEADTESALAAEDTVRIGASQ